MQRNASEKNTEDWSMDSSNAVAVVVIDDRVQSSSGVVSRENIGGLANPVLPQDLPAVCIDGMHAPLHGCVGGIAREYTQSRAFCFISQSIPGLSVSSH